MYTENHTHCDMWHWWIICLFPKSICVVLGQFSVPHPGPAGMGRGYAGYSTMTPGYPATAPMVGAAYGYGASTPFCSQFMV